MSNNSHSQEQPYAQAIHRYMVALEHGDIEGVAMILHEAEQDAVLEQMLLGTNTTYQKNEHITINSSEMRQAQVILLDAFLSFNNERVDIQEERMQPMYVQQFPVQQEEVFPVYSSNGTRLRRLSAFAQTLVAVLVVGLLVSGFALLFSSRHQISLGTGSLGSSGATTLLRSVIVASTDDGIVYGIQPDTGNIVWHYATGKSVFGGHGNSTVALQGQVVYYTIGSQLYAFRATNGTLLWHKNLNVSHAVITNYNKIVVEKGIVFVSGQSDGTGLPGGIVYALSTDDGRVLWSYREGGANPLLAVHNSIVYVEKIVDDHGHQAVQALKAGNGSLLWSYTIQVMAVVATDTNVYVYSAHPIEDMGRNKQNKFLLALDTKGKLLWTRPIVDDGVNSLIMGQGVLIVGEIDGKIYHICAYRTTNGAQAWCTPNETVPLAANTYSYVVLGNMLYSSTPIASSTGDTLEINAHNISDGSLRWNLSIAETFALGKPVVMSNNVYVVGYHKVYAIDDANGRIRWQLVNNTDTFSSIAVGSW